MYPEEGTADEALSGETLTVGTLADEALADGAPAPQDPAGYAGEQGTADRIIDAAFSLAEVRGWSRLPLAAVAEAAGLDLLDVYREMPSKLAILIAFGRRLDRQVLAGVYGEEGEETPRDRLFDVLMRRFDALLPFREGVRAIARDLRRDPLTALAGSPQFMNSMAWMLEAAGIPLSGMGGVVRANGLARVYLSTQRTFLDDDTPDLSRTMAVLDQKLRRSSRMLGLSAGGSFPWSRARHATEPTAERSYSDAYAWDEAPQDVTPEPGISV